MPITIDGHIIDTIGQLYVDGQVVLKAYANGVQVFPNYYYYEARTYDIATCTPAGTPTLYFKSVASHSVGSGVYALANGSQYFLTKDNAQIGSTTLNSYTQISCQPYTPTPTPTPTNTPTPTPTNTPTPTPTNTPTPTPYPSVTLTYTVSCVGGQGRIRITAVTGGNDGPYEVTIDNGATWTAFTNPNQFDNLPDGAYVLQGRDSIMNYGPTYPETIACYVAPTATPTPTPTPTPTNTPTPTPTPGTYNFEILNNYTAGNSTAAEACSAYSGFQRRTYYSAQNFWDNGMYLWLNSSLTAPAPDGWYSNGVGARYFSGGTYGGGYTPC